MYVLRKMPAPRSWRAVRWAAALAGGAFWWWAVARLALDPAQAGPVEGALAAGGWGLGLVPLRATTRPAVRRARRRASGARRLPRPRGSVRPLPPFLSGTDSAVRADRLTGHNG